MGNEQSSLVNAELETMIRKRLDNIRELQRQCEQAESPSAALLVQGEIHRQFLLADWQLLLESRRIAAEVTEMPCKEDCATLVQLKQLVVDTRTECNATVNDLSKMPVYAEPENYFPFYWELPGAVVRQRILVFLTNPQDKLNMITAFPCEGHLMGWNQIALDFEVTFAKNFANGELSWRTINSIDTLRNASAHFRKVINRRFEDYLANNLEYMKEQEYGPVEHSLSDIPVHNDYQERLHNPFTAPVNINLGGTDAEVENATSDLPQVGEQIWDLVIEVWVNSTALDMLQRIQNCLRHTPNVRRLLVFENWSDDDAWELDNGQPEEIPVDDGLLVAWRNLENLELPNMPFLTAIRFELNSFAHALVRRKLLEAYGKQLHHLAVCSVSQIRDFNHRLSSSCPLLTTLIVKSPSTDGVAYPLRVFNRFSECPLTVIEVQLDMKRDAPEGFGQLLQCLSRNFGATLKELTLCLQKYSDTATNGEVQRRPSFPVLSSLKFRSSKPLANDHHTRILAWLQLAPLKIVDIKIGKKSRNLFPEIIYCLCNYFGKTLEQLNLNIYYQEDTEQPLSPLPVSMADLEFPKLKHLAINVDPHPTGWEFLLMFPALEKMVFTSIRNPGSQVYAKEKLVELTSNVKILHGSHIWKWLPHLKEVVLTVDSPDFQTWSEGKITRAECIAVANAQKNSQEVL